MEADFHYLSCLHEHIGEGLIHLTTYSVKVNQTNWLQCGNFTLQSNWVPEAMSCENNFRFLTCRQNLLQIFSAIHQFVHITFPPETTFFLQWHLDGTLQTAHQPGGLYQRVECCCLHLQCGRHGGLLQRGSYGKQIWQVEVFPAQLDFFTDKPTLFSFSTLWLFSLSFNGSAYFLFHVMLTNHYF